jgi:cell division protein FtsQ
LSANSTALRSDAPVEATPLSVELPRRRWVLAVALTALIAGSLAWVGNSPVFRMRELRVTGEQHLSEADVARLSGLTSKTNVLWISGSAVARRLESDPWIQSAVVARHLPGEIDIVIRERTAVARIPQSGGQFELLAGDGKVLGMHGPSATGVPILRVARPAAGAQAPAATPAGMKGALLAVTALPASVRSQVTTATQRPDGSVILRLDRGATVTFGTDDQAAEKGRVLQALLEWSAAHGVTPRTINVETPTAPAMTHS